MRELDSRKGRALGSERALPQGGSWKVIKEDVQILT